MSLHHIVRRIFLISGSVWSFGVILMSGCRPSDLSSSTPQASGKVESSRTIVNLPEASLSQRLESESPHEKAVGEPLARFSRGEKLALRGTFRLSTDLQSKLRSGELPRCIAVIYEEPRTSPAIVHDTGGAFSKKKSDTFTYDISIEAALKPGRYKIEIAGFTQTIPEGSVFSQMEFEIVE